MPLSDSERRELIRIGLQRKLAPDEIFGLLQQADVSLPETAEAPSGASPVRAIPEPVPEMTPPKEEGIGGKIVRFGQEFFSPSTPTDIRQERARQALDVGVTGLTSEIGGGLVRPAATKLIERMALKRGLLPWAGRTAASLASPAARSAGSFIGDVGVRAIDPGQKVDLAGAGGRAAGQFALEAGLGQAGRMLARGGGVNPEAAAAAQVEGSLPWMKPKGEAPLLRPTSVSEFKGMGQEVAEAAHNAGDIANAPHKAYMGLISKDPDRLIDAGPIFTAVKERVSGAGMGPNRAADTQLLRGLRDLRSKIRPGGMISVSDADEWIRVNLTPAAMAAQSGSEAAFNEAADLARKKAAPYLYGKVAPEAGALQQATKDMLTKIGAVETDLPKQTAYKPHVSTPKKLRQSLIENEEGQEVRDRLGSFDKTFGTRLLPRTQRLAMRESWKPLNTEEAGRMFETVGPKGIGGMVRLGKAAGRGPGKLLTKVARPSGRVLTAYMQALAAQREAEQARSNP